MLSRRRVLTSLVAVAVSGFDLKSRNWVGNAAAAPDLERVPRLDGALLTDPSSLAAAATDAGNNQYATPLAVLRPASVRDIQRMVRFCRRHAIQVAARGQGHTTFGQSLVPAGLVIEMSSLSQIHWLGSQQAEVDAGATWRQLVTASVPHGLRPPVLTGYTGLSIGGTLSVGGISPTNRHGAQVDHVRQLEVVTGTGEHLQCSDREHPDLFEAVLAGLGQCGIITRAVVEMVKAPSMARVFLLNYADLSIFFRDLRTLLRRAEFDDISTLWVPDENGRLIQQLNAVRFFDSGAPPDNAKLLRGLTLAPENVTINDDSYLNYALRVDFQVDYLQAMGLWNGVLHPWFDVWLPERTIETYLSEVLPNLTLEDVGPTGLMLLYPQRRSKLERRFLRVPASSEWVYLFDILTSAAVPGPDPAFQNRMLTRNRVLFERARALGGTRYPIGSLSFNRDDWRLQYGPDWPAFARLKHRFDPDDILTPGPGIFA